MVSLYLLKKYSVKVEKLSLGGVNILFNESATLLQKKSVKKSPRFKKEQFFKLRKKR